MKRATILLLTIAIIASACATSRIPDVEIPATPHVCEDEACVDRFWRQLGYWMGRTRKGEGIHLVYPDGRILQAVGWIVRGTDGYYFKIDGVIITGNVRQHLRDTIPVPPPPPR
jgi:hypothetical protein